MMDSASASRVKVDDNDSSFSLPPFTAPGSRPVTTNMSDTSTDSDVEALGQEKASSQDNWTPTKREWAIMVSLAFISMMVALDATILVTVLPEIARKLEGTAAEAFWAATSYLLTSAIFQPVIASISQVFGRQQLLVVSLLCFTIGTILCSISTNFTMMLTGRCIQGIGGGGIITLTQVVYCDIVPLRHRFKYFPMVLLSWSVGTIIGPVVGGVLTEKSSSWRWCFHINYPFCGLGLIAAIFFVRLDRVDDLSLVQKLKQTDWIGAFLFIGGMTSFLVGLSWGGVQHPWQSAATLAPIIAGLAAILVFGWWQHFAKPHSLLPMSIFYNWSIIAAFYCALMNGLTTFTALYYIPLYLMSVRGNSSITAGKDVIPALCLMLPGSIIVSLLSSRIGRFRWAVWGGCALTTLACGLLILFGLRTKMAMFYGILAILGVGLGMVLTSVNISVQAISDPENCAMAASMYGFFRSLGMPLGVAISGTVFQNTMSDHLSGLGLPIEIAHDSERWVYILRSMGDSPKKTAILESYMKGFESVFILMTGLAASALLASFFIKKFSMDKLLVAQFSAR